MSDIIVSKRTRNSSIELLRIIAMLFIVMSHSSVHGEFPNAASLVPINNYFLDWFVLGNLGVVIFVLISGYFLCTKEFKIQSVIKLLAQVWFFSYLCLAISLLTGNTVSFKEIIVAIFPTIFGLYWFFTAYIVMLVLSPFINIFVNNISQKEHRSCLIIMMTLWSVIPTFTTRQMFGSELPQFLMFYLLGAYLRKYPSNALSNPKTRRWLVGCSGTMLFASSAVFRFLNDNIWSITVPTTLFYSRSSILVIGLAIGMVATAVYHKPWSNKIVNTISSCTFGVYLFHDNSCIRRILWPVWLNNGAYYDSRIFVLRLLASVIVVFIGCTLVEYLRQRVFAQSTEYLLEKVYGLFSRAGKRCAIILKRAYHSSIKDI